MPRSFLIKKNNYSNCPLKKRPVTLYKESQEDESKDVADDNSEPENLSTKPEDLSITASQNHYPHKAITPPPGVALISAKRTPLSERPDAVTTQPTSGATSLNHVTLTSPHHHPHYLGKTSGGPLEPLNLNTPAETHHHHHYASSPTSWHRGVAPHYPPPYFTFNYPYPPPAEMYNSHHQYTPSIYPVSPARSSPLMGHTHPHHHQEQQLSPYAPRDSNNSPPHHLFSTSTLRAPVSVVASLPHRQQAAELPKLYMPYQPVEHCGLSPTSSVASSTSNTAFQSLSPPPATPEDLSSPGSVSSGSSSAGSTGGGKKRKEGTMPRYQCPDCSKSYSTYSGLSKHQQFHCAATAGSQAKKSFSCKYCEKVYVSLGALKMHIRTHTLPCKCKLCGKAFSRPWLLQGHIRTHTGEKPFSCPHCNRAFADRSNLRAHLQTHSDIKKYSCTTCSKTFSRMSLLTKHMDGGCPGNNNSTTVIPQYIIQRDTSSGDEAKIYQ